MALLDTPVCDFGWRALDFRLLGVDGREWTLGDVRGKKGVLVMFICNHCPYVRSIAGRLEEDMREIREAGVGVVAIMPNDTESYPQDGFDEMKLFAQKHGFGFPYVLDETQEVARGYGAVCTPDFFGFNSQDELQYRGRLDGVPVGEARGGEPRELVEAMCTISRTGAGPKKQIPSMGCSIKWK